MRELLTLLLGFLLTAPGGAGWCDFFGGDPHRGAGAESGAGAAVRPDFICHSHNLSTIRDADLILVEAGQIVEQGTHASLLAAGGDTPGFTRRSSWLL